MRTVSVLIALALVACMQTEITDKRGNVTRVKQVDPAFMTIAGNAAVSYAESQGNKKNQKPKKVTPTK